MNHKLATLEDKVERAGFLAEVEAKGTALLVADELDHGDAVSALG